MIKLIHILGAILFLGNLVISAVWRMQAEKNSERSIKLFSIKLIQRTDLIFTLPGIVLIAVSGHMLAGKFGGIGAHGWIYHSYAMLTVSALIWLAGLIPIQKKQLRMTQDAEGFDSNLPPYKKLNRLWAILSGIATLLPLVALYLMIVRPG